MDPGYGKAKRLKIGILNFAAAHQDPDKYKLSFKKAYRLRRPIEMAAHRFAMIMSLREQKGGFILGTVARFNEIDLNLPWFDINNLSKAEDEIIDDIAIPEQVRPNFTSIYFGVDSISHKLFFEVRSPSGGMSPKEALKFFQRLFVDQSLVAEFGAYQWSIVSESGTFNNIIEGIKVKSIEFFVQRPNPDDHGELERLIAERLLRTNSQSYAEKYTSVSGEGITPDDHMIQLAEVSETNGETIIRGTDSNGVSVTRSTSEYPEIITHTYPSEEVGEREAFRSALAERGVRRAP